MRLAYFFLAAVLAIAAPVWAKRAQPRTELFTQAELSRLTEQEQEQYFEALRDFMEARQEPSPSFAHYFLDAMLGQLPAFADELECSRQIYRNGNVVGFDQLNPTRNPDCYAKFLNAIKNGELGTCSQKPAPGIDEVVFVTCSGKGTYEIHDANSGVGSQASLQRAIGGSTYPPVPNYADTTATQPAIASDARQSRAQTAAAAPPAARGGLQPARPAPSDRTTTRRAADAADETARCAYAGFLISRKGGSSCAYITDLCAANLRIRPESSISTMQKAIGCPDNPGMKCGTGTTGTAAARNKVACNPLLYGYKGEGADKKKWKAICVAPGKNASANCRSAMDELAKKNLKELIKSADGKKAFEDTTKEINNVCKRHWKLSNGNEEITEAAADTTHDNDRREDKNRGDFQKTCLTLLNRVREIAREASGPASTTAPVPQPRPAAAGTGTP